MTTRDIDVSPVDSQELLSQYLRDCARRNLARTTLRSKEYILRRVDRQVGLLRATPERLGAWLDRDLMPASRATYLATLRAFYAWCVENDQVHKSPTRTIRSPRLVRREPSPISREDLGKALGAAEPVMECWLLLAAAGGLRCAEIAALCVEDVNLEEGWITVRAGKGASERVVPLHPELARALTRVRWPSQGRFWASVNAQIVSQRGSRFFAGLGVTATMHKLRHYAATEYWRALNESGTPDILLLTDFLGHASPVTSMIYTHRDQAKGRNAMRNFSIGAPDVGHVTPATLSEQGEHVIPLPPGETGLTGDSNA